MLWQALFTGVNNREVPRMCGHCPMCIIGLVPFHTKFTLSHVKHKAKGISLIAIGDGENGKFAQGHYFDCNVGERWGERKHGKFAEENYVYRA